MANNFKFNLRNLLIAISVLILLGIGLALYLIWVAPESEDEGVVGPDPSNVSEGMKAGTEGEIEEGKTLEEVNPEAIPSPVRSPGTPMPPSVFDTKGEILTIGSEGLTVRGTGENFEDQKSRNLTVKITSQTVTFEKGREERYEGLEGLDHLEIGETILISTSENIRGKTEFEASYINKI